METFPNNIIGCSHI